MRFVATLVCRSCETHYEADEPMSNTKPDEREGPRVGHNPSSGVLL